MEKVVLNKVVEWLANEVETYKRIKERIDGGEDHVNVCDAPEIFYGRNECAESLLRMILTWEEEEENKPRKTMTMADITEERRKNPEKYLSQYTIDEMKKLGLPIRRDK